MAQMLVDRLKVVFAGFAFLLGEGLKYLGPQVLQIFGCRSSNQHLLNFQKVGFLFKFLIHLIVGWSAVELV